MKIFTFKTNRFKLEFFSACNFLVLFFFLVGSQDTNAQYCAVSTIYDSDYISLFTTSGATNNVSYTASSNPEGGYEDLTDIVFKQAKGLSFNFSTTYVTGNQTVAIWIDWNDDGAFDNTEGNSEKSFYQYASGFTQTGSILVPASVELGTYRVRVRSQYGPGLITPCGALAWGTTLDFDLEVLEAPPCIPPTFLTASNVTFTTADLSWTSDGSLFDIQWGEAPFEIGSSTEIVGVTNNYQLSNLESDVKYQYYVRKDCAGDKSSWSGPYTFVTGYCEVSAEYVDNFTSSFSTSGAISNVQYSATSSPTGSYANLSSDYIEQVQGLSFDFVTAYAGGSHKINIWVDWNKDLTFDNSEGNPEKVFSQYVNGLTQTGTIVIPAGTAIGTYRVRVRSQDGNGALAPCGQIVYGSTLDYTLNVLSAPSCFPPSALGTQNITDESAELLWTSDGTLFDIQWGNVPFEIGDGVEILGVTSNPYTLSGLTPDTNFQFYVRKDCTTEQSYWSGPYKFYTGYCLPNASANTTGNLINNFSTASGYTNIENLTGMTSSLDSYGSFTDMSVAQSPGGQFSYSVTVPIFTKVEIWIDYNKNLVFDADEIVAVHNYGTVNPVTMNGTITVPSNLPLGDYRMRVRSRYYYQSVADPCDTFSSGETEDYTVSVIAEPSCFPPTMLGVQNTLPTSTNLSWTSDGALFDLEWAEAPFVPGEGSQINGITTTSYTLNGLEADTAYQYYVRQDCTTGESFWSGPFNFFTGYCLPPASTNPANYLINSVSTSNGYTNLSNATGAVPSVGSYNHFVDYSLSQSPGGSFSYSLVVPAYTNVEMWIDFNQNLVFDADEIAAVLVYGITPSVTLTGTIDVPANLPLGDYRIRLRSRYAFQTNSNPCSQADYGEVEDYTLSIIAPPSCLPPAALTVNNVNTTSAELSWVSDGTLFEMQFGAVPFELGQGTLQVVTGTSVTLSLTESTTYQYYVRQNCEASANGLSFWSGPYTFTTATVGQIGGGATTSDKFPINSCYNYNYSQQIYLASELALALEPNTTLITEIRFKPTSVGFEGAPNFADWNVYMGNTTQSEYASSTSWIASSGMVEVFSGALNFVENQWVSIVLDSPFLWDGISNLVIGVDENTDDYSCTANWSSYNAGTNRGILYYDDYNNPNPTTPTNANFGPNANIAQIQFAAEVNLSVGNFETNSFTAYPNPVKDVLNVSFTENISDVAAYNLLGQQVLFMNMNATKGQVDMSNLASGTYLVKVNAENAVKTIKVIKQ
jgi:hypothetical protein